MTDKTKILWNYLQNNRNKNITAEIAAKETGLSKRQVDGIFTTAFQRKGLGQRITAQEKNDAGIYINVKYLVLKEW